MPPSHVGLNIDASFLNIPSNVESVTWGLRDSEAIIEGKAGWDSSEAWKANKISKQF